MITIHLPVNVPVSQYEHRLIFNITNEAGELVSVTKRFKVKDNTAPIPYFIR